MVYTLQVDHYQQVELALLAAGAEIELGDMVEKFDAWLESVPDQVDTGKNQLLTALGVNP